MMLRELDIPKILPSQLALLYKDFTDEEIRRAMFSLNGAKTPGLDSFSAEFFKKHWNTVGQIVTLAAKRFLKTGFLLKEWNHSILCLVNRLKHAMPDLISNTQHVFLTGRQMTDNILLSHEAYEFPPHWIHMIHQCISTVSYSVLLNGDMSQQFKPTRELRQEDPLSSYLFLFCMNILSRMLDIGYALKMFEGIKLPRRGPSISHLFFEDDALLFFRATKSCCQTVTNILHRFCKVSG
ncbi:uncharacterized protein LOC110701255 [Chenopodium quinoa]|uniref:uncharacterized protein LOC110701255 n=1 Tax=Chenopodium quinoa TaxID=63459 RepID=UPI000B795068|nr:uncharacterized protein LOC110701255 [Chenopodium quinoa]